MNENFNRFWKNMRNKTRKNTDFVEILFSAFQSGDKEKETAPFLKKRSRLHLFES